MANFRITLKQIYIITFVDYFPEWSEAKPMIKHCMQSQIYTSKMIGMSF